MSKEIETISEEKLEQVSGGADSLSALQLQLKASMELWEQQQAMQSSLLDSTARALSSIFG